MYLETCCNRRNLGLSIIKHKDDATISIIMCPSILPVNCPKSCLERSLLYPNSVSGYYNVTLYNGSIIEVYCDMKGDNCDGEGGWTRIAYINTTLPKAICPEGLVLEYYNNTDIDHGVCKRNSSDLYIGCDSVYYSSNGYQYSQVCGQARGYSDQALGFYYYNYFNTNLDLNSIYVDGVSITRGDPRQHIWTYAAGHHSRISEFGCPCIINGTESVPPFVGNDYYCEELTEHGTFSDALWDGADCESYEGTCCQQPHMPWFIKQIGEETSDDIEVRLCYFSGFSLVAIDILEIFVK